MPAADLIVYSTSLAESRQQLNTILQGGFCNNILNQTRVPFLPDRQRLPIASITTNSSSTNHSNRTVLI